MVYPTWVAGAERDADNPAPSRDNAATSDLPAHQLDIVRQTPKRAPSRGLGAPHLAATSLCEDQALDFPVYARAASVSVQTRSPTRAPVCDYGLGWQRSQPRGRQGTSAWFLEDPPVQPEDPRLASGLGFTAERGGLSGVAHHRIVARLAPTRFSLTPCCLAARLVRERAGHHR